MLELQTANKNKRTKNGGGDGITALYCRLSVDDNGTEGESNSIKNQRDILGRYAKQHGYRNIEYYIDDGYSGTNFNRPDFQRMMSDVDEGKVKTIIVKDMSRLGRDYLKVGYLTEFTFAEKDIHFIAINDNVDSENGSDNELIPFKNVFNEWLARDTSKKIRAVIRNKGESGKPLTNTPPLGYMKDPNDKNKWLIDERCAPTIREIFRLCINGYNALAIAKILTEKGYDTPKAFYLKQGRNMYRNDTTAPYFWHRSTVYKILRNPNYIGHLVNFKTTRKSYKNKRFVYRDPSEWKIIENHHEAIVDKETFNLAQKLTQVKRVVKNHFDDINIFAGLLYCADCGFPITLRRVAKNRNYDFYACSKYNRRTKTQCTAHSILKRVLNELVREDIKRVMKEVKTHESEFIEKYRKCSVKEMRGVRLSAQTKIVKAENRIKTLDDIIANLYEDNVTGKISDERFDSLAKKYEAEQTALKSEIVELKKALDVVNDEESNIREFLKVVNSYTETEELTPEILNNFIDRIYIGEKYADGSTHKQEIRIIYKFIGAESTHGYKVKGSRVAEIF